MTLPYEDLQDAMFEALPELKSFRAGTEHILAETPSHPPPLNHVVCMIVLHPYLDSLLGSEGSDEALPRVFAFLERMATSEDSRVRDVLRVTVCEHLEEHPDWLKKARGFMGEETRRISRMVEGYRKAERGVKDPALHAIIGRLYQAIDPAPGGTAARTSASPDPGQIRKARALAAALERLLASGQLSKIEAIVAQAHVRDLREALDRRRAAGTLDYGNVTTALFEAVPEVRGPYEEQAESWGLPSEPHAVFGLVVVPELLRRLEAREDSEGVKRMFAFLERMATAEDPAVREIVEMTVCPSFHETRALLDGARKQMGEATLGISRALDAEVRRGSPG